MKKKPRSVEQQFPTKHARELADAAVDALPVSESMSKHLDVWYQTYKANGGIEK